MASANVRYLLKTIEMARSRFLYGLERTPDDRLTWSPGGAASTPLQVAGRMAAFVGFLARLLQDRTMPDRQGGLPPPPGSREEARAALEAAFERLQTAVAAVTEADLEQTVPTPWNQMTPIAQILWWLPGLIGYGQGQLNYLQTAYGDTDPNIPPGWGEES